mgnify:CR=1 FL=1
MASLFPDLVSSVARPDYLPSVQYGGIAEVFARVVTHFLPPRLPRPVVVDVTHRIGQFWDRCRDGYRVIGLDLDRSCPVSAVADWRSVPICSGVADLVVFDPPWSQNNRGAARDKYTSPFNSVGQLLDACAPAEWARVAKLDGLLIVRCMTSHHEHGVFFDLPHILKTRFAPWWTTYDEVMYAHGTRKPNQTMNRPKTWKCHSWFLIMEKTEVAKVPQEKRTKI